MIVAPFGVGLPYLHQRIADRLARSVANDALNSDRPTLSPRAPDDVLFRAAVEADPQIGADGL